MELLAAAVVDYPAAVGIELMNEPPAIERGSMYETWESCYNAIRVRRIHTHTHMHTHTHAHMHTCTHARARAHTHDMYIFYNIFNVQ